MLDSRITDIQERTTRIIADHLAVDPARVTSEATLDDLGGDSLDALEIVMYLEEEFGVAIDDDEAAGVETVGDFVTLIERTLK